MLHTFILILHVLGSGIILGVVFFSVLAVIRPTAVAQQIDRLLFVARVGMWASGWQLATGIILYLMEPEEFQANSVFGWKIGLYIIEGAFASLVLNKQLKRLEKNPTSQTSTRMLTGILIVHALLIAAIVVLGVMVVEQ